MLEDKDISFVVKHYRRGSFATDKAWSSLEIVSRPKWHGMRAAAAVIVIVVLSATAAVVYNHFNNSVAPASQEASGSETMQSAAETVRVIDFEETPLTEVVDKINEIYKVEIVNLPADAADYKLSLRYEGTAEDLVETINDILGTDMIILWP